MFDYIDSSGNVITYDQINKMAKEGKTSFDAIVKKNGYKPKPKPKTTKVKSGAELLGIDTTAKKAAAVTPEKKKTPVVKETVVESKPTFTPSSDPLAGTKLAQPIMGGKEMLLSEEYKKERAKKLQEEKKQLEIDEAALKAREAKRVNKKLLTENKVVFDKADEYITSIGLNPTEKEEQNKKAVDEINGNTFFEKAKAGAAIWAGTVVDASTLGFLSDGKFDLPDRWQKNWSINKEYTDKAKEELKKKKEAWKIQNKKYPLYEIPEPVIDENSIYNLAIKLRQQDNEKALIIQKEQEWFDANADFVDQNYKPKGGLYKAGTTNKDIIKTFSKNEVAKAEAAILKDQKKEEALEDFKYQSFVKLNKISEQANQLAKDNQAVPEELIKEYNNSLNYFKYFSERQTDINTELSKTYEKFNDYENIVDSFNRDWGRISNIIESGNQIFQTAATGVEGALDWATKYTSIAGAINGMAYLFDKESPIPEEVTSFWGNVALNSKKEQEERALEFAKQNPDLSFSDYSLKDFADFAVKETMNVGSVLAHFSNPVGIGLFVAEAGGNKQVEMLEEMEREPGKYNEFQKFALPLTYAGVDAVLAYGMKGQIDKAKLLYAAGNNTQKSIIRKGFFQYLTPAEKLAGGLKDWGGAIVHSNAIMGGAVFSKNALNIIVGEADKSTIFDGLDGHLVASATFFAGLTKGAPLVASEAMYRISGDKAIDTQSKKIVGYEEKLRSTISNNEKKVIQELLAKAKLDLNVKLEEKNEKLKTLNNKQWSALISANKKSQEILKQGKEIKNDKSISDEIKRDRLKELEKEFNEYQEQKTELFDFGYKVQYEAMSKTVRGAQLRDYFRGEAEKKVQKEVKAEEAQGKKVDPKNVEDAIRYYSVLLSERANANAVEMYANNEKARIFAGEKEFTGEKPFIFGDAANNLTVLEFADGKLLQEYFDKNPDQRAPKKGEKNSDGTQKYYTANEILRSNYGIRLPNGQKIISYENAAVAGRKFTGIHETGHDLFESFNSMALADQKKILDEFLNELSNEDEAALKKRLKDYDEDELAKNMDEYFTQYIEIALEKKSKNGDLKAEDNIEMGESIDFTSGKDVKQYIDNVLPAEYETGNIGTRTKELLKKATEIRKQKGAQRGSSFSKAKVEEVQKKIDNLEEQFDKGEIDYDDYTGRLEAFEKDLEKAKKLPEEVTKSVAKKEVTEEDIDKEIIKNEKGSISSDKVQTIYEEKGVNGAQEIIDLFKPITKKLVNKRMDAPGFDRELLTSEIETGDGGLLYLIRSYKPEKGVPLAAYINKQLPLRAIAASRRVLDKDFSKDVTEEKGLIAEETVSEAKEKPKYKNALESNVFSPEVLKTAINKIVTVVRTLKNRIDAPVTLNRTVTPLISEIKDNVGKQLDIDLKTMLGGKKDGVFRKELLRSKRYILENMTTTWLMGKDGQGGIPQAIQKQINGKWVSYPDWVGQKIDREKTTTDQAGRTSGAELVRRSPNVFNNIPDEVFLAQFIGPDGNPIRGRKESVSKAMAEEGAFDIINADLAEEGPIFQALATNQERLGYEIANNFAANFSMQAERGNVKQSKALKEALDVFENLDKNAKLILRGEDGSTFTKFMQGVKNENNVEKLFNRTYGDNAFEPEDRNKIVNAIKSLYSFYKKQSGKSTAKRYGINLNEDFKSFANRRIFNALSKDQSLALTLNIPNSDLQWKSKDDRKDARTHMKNFYTSAIKNFTENKKMSRQEAQKLFTRLFSRAFSYGRDQSLFGNQRGFFNAFLKRTKAFTMGAGEIRGSTIKYKGEKVNSNIGEYSQATSAKDISRFIKTGEFSEINIEERRAISAAAKKDLKILITALKDMYSNKQVNDTQLGLIFKSLGGSMNSPLKLASELRYVAEKGNYSNDTKEWVYEHVPPTNYISRIALGIITEKTNMTIDEFMGKLIDNSYVTILPKSFDKSVNELYKSNMPFYYEIGDNPLIRYLDAGFNGKEVPAFYDLYDKKQISGAIVKDAFSSKIIKNTEAAILGATKLSKAAKGISVFDFDDTVGLTKGSVLYTMPNGKKGKLNAEEFAKNGSKLLNEGADFDFSEFSKVVGGKPGPMVEKMKKMIGKFGPDNFFILTARPADAAGPIHEFLSSIGIDIPIENITGLGNSTGKAKADWMVGKAAEGYNDFYFADDAPQNVKAVQDALDVLDVKSKIQQAKIKFSKTMSDDFNKIIEDVKGVESYKVYSDITARRQGINKNKFDFYVPPSAADFELLLYNFMGKGPEGEAHKKFFQDALIKPYINGVDLMDSVRQSIKKDYKALLKSFPEVKKELEKLTPNKNFTYDQAMRVAIWDQYGIEIPGLAARDKTYLSDLVNNNPELAAFKDGLIVMGRQKEGWLPPDNFWDSNTIVSDLYNITEGSGRKKFLGEFIENAENIFGKWEDGRLVGPNMNKVEATYGTNVREALEDSIYRMTNGKNRSFGQDKESAAWSSWVNGSTGSIMFLNTRSAALQMLGAVNFLNFRDNNPFAAAKAFANQPQYWKDFSRIWNSDKLKERRGGLREDVASAEIANAAAGSKNKVVAVTSYLLKIGYTPTQIADSFAIASGGAPFYRNRIKTYLKEGLPEVEAEAKAWEEFSKVSDETQQSGDPKDISKQQASSAGRILLVFQNFTMQQSRIVKKAALDLKNGRGDAKTNISKIVYYLAVQNIMFSALQQGLFAVAFDDDGDDKDKKKKTKEEAAMDLVNGVLDSILRGTGFVGGVAATLKNTIIKYFEEQAKKQKAEYAKVILEAANMSPPIGSKLRKTYSALQQTKYDKDLIAERGWGVMQDGRVHLGPMYSVSGKLVEATTNFPMDRLVNKVENVSQAFNSENTAVQRLATGMGYSPWTVGIEGTKGDILIKETAKATRKEEGIIKAMETREATKDSIRNLTGEGRVNYLIQQREEKIKARRRKIDMIEKRNKRRMGE
jgi:hypothetical protein